MKRFGWPLQRLLDVTRQREAALRAELFALSRELARIRQEIVRRRAALRASLEELSALSAEARIAQQAIFLRHAATAEKRIQHLAEQQAERERRRAEGTSRLLRTRTRRQTLEKLREEALRQYRTDFSRWEQKQLDEGANLSSARRVLAVAVGGATDSPSVWTRERNP